MIDSEKPSKLTELLRDWRNSTHLRKHEAGGPLFAIIYDDLVKIAANVNFSHSVEPRELVHQLYVKWQGDAALKDWKNRVDFFRAAKAALRNLVIDRYREARRFTGDSPSQLGLGAEAEDLEFIRFHDTITEIGQEDEVGGQVLLMKYYSPDTDEQIAKALEVSEATAKRLFKKTDAELRRRMGLPPKKQKQSHGENINQV